MNVKTRNIVLLRVNSEIVIYVNWFIFHIRIIDIKINVTSYIMKKYFLTCIDDYIHLSLEFQSYDHSKKVFL